MDHVKGDQINVCVHHFIINNKDWDWPLSNKILPTIVISKFQCVLNNNISPNELVWYTNDGCFTLFSTY